MFYVLSLMALFAGLIAIKSPKYSVIALGLMLSVVPTGNSYSGLISMSGIYFFDLYTVGAIGALTARSLVLPKSQLMIPATLLLGFGVYLILLSIGLLVSEYKYLLKDTRPIIMMLSFITLSNVVRLAKDKIVLRDILKLLTAMSLFNILDITWLRLGLYQFQDVYYEENAYRYLDGGTYAAVGFIIFYFIDPVLFRSEKHLARFCLLAAFICLFIANSRFIFFATFAAIIIHQYTKPARAMGLILLAVIFSVAFIQVSGMIGADRITDGLSSQGLLAQLATRFSPAITLIQDMQPVNYVLGFGAGTPFDIPWFDYRGLDDKNANIDSAYLTYFVKYGVLGLYLLIMFTRSVVGPLQNKVAISMATFLGLMFVVSATPYQPYALGIAYAAILLRGVSVTLTRSSSVRIMAPVAGTFSAGAQAR